MEILPVEIKRADLFSEINMRTYYQGESLKRKDTDYVSVQTSSDDEDILSPMMETALNEIYGKLIKKVKKFEWEVEDGIVKMKFYPYDRLPPHAEKVVELLKKSIIDYIANFCVAEWFHVVKPELAPLVEQKNDLLMYRVIRHVAMLSGQIRRRPTDLAGI